MTGYNAAVRTAQTVGTSLLPYALAAAITALTVVTLGLIGGA